MIKESTNTKNQEESLLKRNNFQMLHKTHHLNPQLELDEVSPKARTFVFVI
jgi:hypothetical protein